MLFADKEHLRADAATAVLRVREREIDFYMQNLSVVSTQATLIAGFAFAFLSNTVFESPSEGVVSYAWEQALGMCTPAISDHCDEQHVGFWRWNWVTWWKQMFQLAQISATTACMFVSLWALHTAVVAQVMGPNLALRGPPGSVDRAVRHMASNRHWQ